ncbi:MAG: Gfo/Idh/MocA family protein [Paracoccaceae bacterium]
MTTTELAIVGVGKIARDQHAPAIEASDALRLAATVSRSGGLDGVENHESLDALFDARPDVGAVVLSMPPQARFAAAAQALRAGRHVMLEKPPGVGVAEVLALERMTRETGVSLFATWHSRHAAGVAPARAWLAERRVQSVAIDWREDVREWHPGQQWIWQAGGLGVFDPGINALSILTTILPEPLRLTEATLSVPENRDTPIAADLRFETVGGAPVVAGLDWRHEGPPVWEIRVATDEGRLVLAEGGARLAGDDAAEEVEGPGEYVGLYRRFAELIARGESDVDVAPFLHVADAFMLGRRRIVAPFHD